MGEDRRVCESLEPSSNFEHLLVGSNASFLAFANVCIDTAFRPVREPLYPSLA